MNKYIDLPSIFPDNIISGTTRRCINEFQGIGLTFVKNDYVSDIELERNWEFLTGLIKIERNKISMVKQIHSDKILLINEKADKVNSYIEADGLISNLKNHLILVKIADCAGILLYDKVNQLIGAVHSGWKGSSLGIVTKTIELMKEKYDSKPENILAFISPSASGGKYEVGTEVAKYFPRTVIPIENGKFLFDNKFELKLQLLDSGLEEKNIEISDICTISNENYHSYRRDKEKSGRMIAFILNKA